MRTKQLHLLVALTLTLSVLGVALPAAMPTAVKASSATINVPGDYSTIQAAVNAASSGDTIMVASGNYTENVNVNKPLTIQSVNGANLTTVQAANPADYVFEVTAGNVTISGFTVTGANVNYKTGIYLSGVEHSTISNNIALNNYRGVQLYDSHDNIISQNDLSSNDEDGILINGSNRNLVFGNIANANPGSGIAIAQGNYNRIESNSVSGSWRGISLIGAPISYNTFSNNTISNNNYGIHAYGATSNTMYSNNILNNYWYGISLENYADNNTIYFNNFTNNTNVVSSSSANTWNSPEEITYNYAGNNTFTSYLGNYWSDYSGSDAGVDGIGDTPYIINTDNDTYPLMDGFEGYEIVPEAAKDWTFMVYMAADNNLDKAGLDDLNEMEVVGSSDNVSIVVLLDRWGSGDTNIYYVTSDNDTDNVTSPVVSGPFGAEVNMGDNQTLVDFVKWTIANYPAGHYALVLWDSTAYFSAAWRGLGVDYSSDRDYLTIPEIGSALETILSETGVVPDLVGFDTSLMALVEVGYELATSLPDETIIVASQERESWGGWDYKSSLTALTDNSTMTATDLASQIITDYVNYYNNQGEDWATLSAVNSENVTALATAIDNLAQAMMSSNETAIMDKIRTARDESERFWSSSPSAAYVDLNDFAKRVKLAVSDNVVQGYAQQVMDSVLAAVVAEEHGSHHEPGARGISIYYPSSLGRYASDYPGSYLAFTAATNWDEFLSWILEPDTTPPSIPTLVSPSDNTTASAAPVLEWNKVGDASGVSYSLQVDDDPGFNVWSQMNSGTTARLEDVWGSSGDDVFAVSWGGTILRYNGTDWSSMTSNTTDTLWSVWGSSGSDVFAVGDNGTIRHYDGTDWSPMASNTTDTLWHVWGSLGDDVFAVSGNGTILSYNGTGWSPMTSNTTDRLFGVWGSSGTDVFAVGDNGTILHYDGSNWSPMTSNTTAHLYGVWGSSGDDVFAVGDNGTILHYDGSSWSPMPNGTSYWLGGVWGSSGSDVFVVGDNGTILHYGDGASPLVDITDFRVRGSQAFYRVTPLLAKGIYYWRVQAVDSANNTSGWSEVWSFEVRGPTPKWSYTFQPAINRILLFGQSVAIADLGVNTSGLEEDSDLEIATGSDECGVYNPELDAWVKGTWRVFDSQGNVEWAKDTESDQARTVAIADLDGDGDLEIIGGTTSGETVEVMDKYGNFVWTFPSPPRPGNSMWLSSPAVADVSANVSGLEVIIGNRPLHTIFAFDGDNSDGLDDGISASDIDWSAIGEGTEPWEGTEGVDWDILWIFTAKDKIISTPVVADIDNDGQLEVVFGTGGKIYSLNGADGGLEWSFQTAANDIDSSAGLADFDNDGDLEVVVGASSGKVYFINNNGDAVIETSESTGFHTGDSVHSSPSIGDVDGDGDLEVIIGSNDGNVYSLAYDPATNTVTEEWRYTTDGPIYSSAALANRITGDLNMHTHVLIARPGFSSIEELVSSNATIWHPYGYSPSHPYYQAAIAALDSYGGNYTFVWMSPDEIYEALQSGAIDAAIAYNKHPYWRAEEWASGLGANILPWSSQAIGAVTSQFPRAVATTLPANTYTGQTQAIAGYALRHWLDVYIGSEDGNLYILDGVTGSRLTRFRVGAPIRSSPSVADIDGDGALEVVFADWSPIPPKSSWRADSRAPSSWYEGSGDILWSFKDNRSDVSSYATEWPMFRSGAERTGRYIPGVEVSINAPANVVPDGDFTATVDIGDVIDLNGAQYEIVFDPSVLTVDNVTAGQIGSTVMPVQGFTEVSPGRYRVLQSLMFDTVNGTGYLAVLHFQVIGSLGDNSTIDLSNGILSGWEAEIPATWTGDFVEVSVIPGDADGNGVVNILDLTRVVRMILLIEAETPGADANLDGAVDILDLTKIVRIILMLD